MRHDDISQAVWSYLKIGLFGFGGGYARLALIEREIVASGWITPQMFTDIVAISQMTPGPIGINSATYIGYVAPAATDQACRGRCGECSDRCCARLSWSFRRLCWWLIRVILSPGTGRAT